MWVDQAPQPSPFKYLNQSKNLIINTGQFQILTSKKTSLVQVACPEMSSFLLVCATFLKHLKTDSAVVMCRVLRQLDARIQTKLSTQSLPSRMPVSSWTSFSFSATNLCRYKNSTQNLYLTLSRARTKTECKSNLILTMCLLRCLILSRVSLVLKTTRPRVNDKLQN